MLMRMIHSTPVLGHSESVLKKINKIHFTEKREGVSSYLLACVYTLHPPLSYAPENENFTENRTEKIDKTIFQIHCAPVSPINFFNGWFRLHVRNNLFCLFNKVPDLITQKKFPISFIFKCI